MPSLKDLKNKIGSVKSTQKITKAKQMVAAAKLRRAQEAAQAAKPYADRMESVVANLASSIGERAEGPKLLKGSGSDITHLVVVMTAERGLCGGFNANTTKLAREHINELEASGKKVSIITVGKKGRDSLNSSYAEKFIKHIDLSDVKADFTKPALSLGSDLTERFSLESFDVATLVFSEFKSVLTQSPVVKQLIPVENPTEYNSGSLSGAIYNYEPSEEAILSLLLPRYISTIILSAMLENSAGEQAASMTSMDNATRNAGEIIDDLTLQYNRARQAQITKELIEIISGAEAL